MEPSSCSAPMINVCQKHPGLIILSPWWPFPLIWAILGSCLIQLVISTTRQAQPQHAQPQGMLVKLLPHVVTCCHRGVQQHLSRPWTFDPRPKLPKPYPFSPCACASISLLELSGQTLAGYSASSWKVAWMVVGNGESTVWKGLLGYVGRIGRIDLCVLLKIITCCGWQSKFIDGSLFVQVGVTLPLSSTFTVSGARILSHGEQKRILAATNGRQLVFFAARSGRVPLKRKKPLKDA